MPISPGGTLSDYIPFYFTSRTPMLLNIKTGRNVPAAIPMEDIIILVAAARALVRNGATVLIADRHANLRAAKFSNDLEALDELDWPLLSAHDFAKRVDDPERFERYQAEALVHRQLDAKALDRVVCFGHTQRAAITEQLEQRGLRITLSSEPGWYC